LVETIAHCDFLLVLHPVITLTYLLIVGYDENNDTEVQQNE